MAGTLRRYVEKWVPRVTRYRDYWVEKQGQKVEIVRPNQIASNVYGDLSVIDSSLIARVSMMFDWKTYHTSLREADTSTEENIPLTAMSRVEDDIPKGTLVNVSVYTPDEGISEQKSVFRVIKANVYMERQLHGRQLIMVIHRGVKFQ